MHVRPRPCLRSDDEDWILLAYARALRVCGADATAERLENALLLEHYYLVLGIAQRHFARFESLDVCNEAVVRAVLPGFRQQFRRESYAGSFHGLIATATYRKMQDVARRQAVQARRRVDLEVADGGLFADDTMLDPEEHALRVEAISHVRRVVSRMDADDQALFDLRWVHELSHEEVAVALGVREVTARVRALRFRREAKELLQRSFVGAVARVQRSEDGGMP